MSKKRPRKEVDLKWPKWVSLAGLAGLILLLGLTVPYQNILPQGPNGVRLVPLAFFYLSLWAFLGGFFAQGLFFFRSRLVKKELLAGYRRTSVRQGLLLGLLVVVIFILQSFRLLIWWDALLAVGAILMIELYFLAR